MKTICPYCGKEIEVSNIALSTLCSCGREIQPIEYTFNLPEEQKKVLKIQRTQFKRSLFFFICFFCFFFFALLGLLIFLLIKVDSRIPLITIPPVLVFMVLSFVLFLMRIKKSKRN